MGDVPFLWVNVYRRRDNSALYARRGLWYGCRSGVDTDCNGRRSRSNHHQSESDDIAACLIYAARRLDHPTLAA